MRFRKEIEKLADNYEDRGLYLAAAEKAAELILKEANRIFVECHGISAYEFCISIENFVGKHDLVEKSNFNDQ